MPRRNSPPVAVYNAETVMRALRIAQDENLDVVFYQVAEKPAVGRLMIPLLTLVENG